MSSINDLLKRKKEIERRLLEIEEELKDNSYVDVIDFSSMYPSILRILNASIENLVGFLDDDPIAYRRLDGTDIMKSYKEKSHQLLKTKYKDIKFTKFVGKKEDKLALRLDLYEGKFKDKPISEMTETPFERYFLALKLGDTKEKFKFQGKEYNAFELREYFKKNHLSISGSGAVYKAYREGKDDKLKQGLVPSYLTFLYRERKRVKKEMNEHEHKKILLERIRDIIFENK